jgi:hypothetical protein
MVILKKAEMERGSNAKPDLGREYRPIGIGAVAAALMVTGDKKPVENQREHAGNSDEHEPYWNSIAA